MRLSSAALQKGAGMQLDLSHETPARPASTSQPTGGTGSTIANSVMMG